MTNNKTQFAWFWIRHLAIFIDWLATWILNMMLWFLAWLCLWISWITSPEIAKIVWFMISFLIWFLYFSLFHYYWGQTLGKMALWIKVVNRWDLKNISLLQSTWRFFATILSALPLMIWYIWPSWDKEKRTFHDMIAQTRVIEIRNTPAWVVIGGNILIFVIIIAFLIISVISMMLMFQNPDMLKTINAVQ